MTDHTPSHDALLALVHALIDTSGPAFARALERSGIESPVATIVFGGKRLGSAAPERELTRALANYPRLWEPNDGSEEWATDLRAFMAKSREILEAAGPGVLKGLNSGGVRFKSKKSLEANQAAMAQAVAQADNRTKRLLSKIRNEPSQVVQSVLKHLRTDAVVWHNSLTFLALKAPDPMNLLMVLAADVLREDKAAELFSPQELAHIARHSMGVWLHGTHGDKTNLRVRTAMTLGDMLDDPERQAHARAVLGQIQSKADIPTQIHDREGAIADIQQQLLPQLNAWAMEVLDLGEEEVGEIPVRLAQAIVEGHAQDYLGDVDWLAARRVEGGKSPMGLAELLSRLEVKMVDLVDADALTIESPTADPAPPPRAPRP